MGTTETASRPGPVDFLADHPVFAALSVAGASAAAGAFTARAVRADAGKPRLVWVGLAALEYAIAAGTVRAVVKRRRRG